MVANDSTEKMVEEMAELQFTDAEIAKIVGFALSDIPKWRECIDRGRLRAEAEVRRAAFQLAKQGSTPAIKQFVEMNARAKKGR